ncbi:MAG: heme biosynthesis protein HemY [Salinarimonas sp.]|nr:heme biosynthesis protein HemY [Salinarimonas sp.]
MWRVLIYLAIIAALAAGAVWLAEQPGSVAFVWDGVSYSVGLAVAALAVLVLVAVILLVEAAGRIVLNLPQRLSGAARERKKRKAIQALSRGMIAVGSGDENAARRHARDAERYLRNDEPLLLLLKAQAAQISGDRDQAEAVFQEMAAVQETRVLGLRGLYVEARRRGDSDAAWKHASEAAKLAPAVDWANEAVLEGLCAQGDWRAAIDTVERRAALGLIDKPAAKRQRAVLLTADALAKGEADEEAALASAKEAVRLAPDLVPAAALAGRILGHRLELRKAGKILEAAWQATPHPDLADAYTHLRVGDSALDRMKRAERLAMLSSWAPEGRIALARAAIEAREFEAARKTLDPLLQEGRPTVRTCLLMAELARVESGSSAGAREWLARAVHAPRDKAWIADGVVSDRWSPISPVSGQLDAFRWQTPPELISGTQVIDDVVGDLDDRARTPTGALAAPVAGDSDAEKEAASEAEIIPPERAEAAKEAKQAQAEREMAEAAEAEATNETVESKGDEQESMPGKPVAAPPEKAAAASPQSAETKAQSRTSRSPSAPVQTASNDEKVAEESPEVTKPEPAVAVATDVAPEKVSSPAVEPARRAEAEAREAEAGKAVQGKAVQGKAVEDTEVERKGVADNNADGKGADSKGADDKSTDRKPMEGKSEGVQAQEARAQAVKLEAANDATKVATEGAAKQGAEASTSEPGTDAALSGKPTADDARKDDSEDERLKRFSRPPDDPGVSPEEAEEARKRKRSFFGSMFN